MLKFLSMHLLELKTISSMQEEQASRDSHVKGMGMLVFLPSRSCQGLHMKK